MPDKATAVEDLTNLINRALHYVQFLRADSVDEVTRAFQVAVQCLENNVEFVGPNGRNEMLNSTTDNLKRIAVETERSEELPSRSAKKVNKPIPKNRIKGGLTRDFDSPGAQTRRLAAAKKSAGDGGGLGLKSDRIGKRAVGRDISDPSEKPKPSRGLGGKLGGPGGPGGPGARKHTKDIIYSPSLKNRSLAARANQPQEEDELVGRRGGQQQDRWEREMLQDDHAEYIHEATSPSAKLMVLAHVSDEARVNTPKAAFIRRLDGKTDSRNLSQAKENLNSMLQSALTNVPQMKMSEYMEIKAKFENALNVLKAGSDVRQQQSYNNTQSYNSHEY